MHDATVFLSPLGVLSGRGILCSALGIYRLILFARLILSYFPNLPEGFRPIARVLCMLTDPLLNRIRPLLPPLRLGAVALDLSPLLVFVLISILQNAIC